MSTNTLNLSCSPKGTTDSQIIQLYNDSVNILKNNIPSSKITFKNFEWVCEKTVSFTLYLDKNSFLDVDPSVYGISNVKVFTCVSNNNVIADKVYENNKLYIVIDDVEFPLGKFFFLSGTDENSIDKSYTLWNGTPNANIELVTDAEYDSTVEIIIGGN